MDADVIIVGGAVAGGALANALGVLGVSTLLIEKVSREVHSTRGDLLHPPTLALLHRWGVLAALHADGSVPITELAVSSAARDGIFACFPLRAADDGPAGRSIAVPHDRIEAVFYACAERRPGVQIERATVTDLLRDDDGRVGGVRLRPHGGADEVVRRARLVVGCDGAQSLVRRLLGIAAEQEPYAHEQVIIAGDGPTELPTGMVWYLDDVGALAVVPRPRETFRVLLTLRLGLRGDLLRRPDPALRDSVVERFPALSSLRFGKQDAHVYRLARHVAECFWVRGAALVGDSAHATHPAGGTGMSLAVTAAARLADAIGPILLAGGSNDDLDCALAAYDAERRPAALAAIASNHAQALRIWQSDLHRDPEAYAATINPDQGWGVGGAGWGQNPAALPRRTARSVSSSGVSGA